ncbi:SMP-30/gluconolactonase/LRE family protein [Microbacterium sp. QXD-8]|uniref:SMP-30/gluconolactonase/LRE family protein n=1 Tax=Microbacterium psychrotolerans TaxID=3068321 RepID=A0ABU0YW14_9MICO|nr:SMP-30/gluconolactonase/LRE family protein [Microbacterium sp. QXD-8]MDQ7876520.1 SMP-30/gluconolactonase/LRE family protein [Microbacterium sp. QXD-8]
MNHYSSTPSLGTARVATGISHLLAEGPLWDPIRGKILWVDVMEGAVHSGRFAYGGAVEVEERFVFPDTAGAVAVSMKGELVVAGMHRLHYRDLDGGITSSAEIITGQGRRFNDGKPDPRGRLVVGTTGPGGELLVRVEPGGALVTLDDDLTLSNGLGWTSDGRRLFSIDTLSKRIYVRDYDPATGAVGERSLLTEFEHGYPDGMAVDVDDHLWVAVWGEGCVVRIDPTGQIVARVDVPAPHTSCPAFAGPELDTLVITTATEDLTPEQLQDYPLSGRLFTIKPGVTGVATHLWSGIR